MWELRNSKYCMFTVFSYVDYSHVSNVTILSKLNKRFRGYSLDKAEDALVMLPRAIVTFQVDSAEKVRKLSQMNLMYFEFGLEVRIQHLRPLLTVLKLYEKPRLLKLRQGSDCLILDARKPSKAVKAID